MTVRPRQNTPAELDRDHRRRIRALEAVPVLTDAIQFGVVEEGSWLDITTTEPRPEGGVGIMISDNSGGGVQIWSDSIMLVTTDFNVNNSIRLVQPTGAFPTDTLQLNVRTTSVDGIIQINLEGTNTRFKVVNGAATLLEVRDDNTLHILSGASWVADL